MLTVIWRVARERPARLALVWALAFITLLLLPFVVLTARAGRAPTYVKGFDLAGWARDLLTLAMPAGERFFYFVNQPLLEAGIADGTGTVTLYYALAVHTLGMFFLLAALTSVYVALFVASLDGRRVCPPVGARRASCGTLAAVSVTGFSGATLSAAACCGGPVGSALLSLLGTSAGLAEWIAGDPGAGGEAVGLVVLLGSILYLAAYLASRSGEPGPVHPRRAAAS